MAPTSYTPSPSEERVKIVDMIYKKRRLLFHPKVDMATRTWAWEAITADAQKQGLFPPERDFIYLRDTRWQNWRKRVMIKYKRNKTKATGGKFTGFDETDRNLFEIVEKFFPNILAKADRVRSLDDSDDNAMDEDSELHSVEFSDVDDPIKVEHVKNNVAESAESDQEEDEIATASILETTNGGTAPDGVDETVSNFRSNGRLRSSVSKDLAMDGLEREMTEMRNYKMKLELIKMERELYLKPSKYTKDIVARQGWHERR